MKRLLIDTEIEYILNFLKPNKSIPIESALSIVNNLKASLIKQLKTIEIYPKLIDTLKEQIEKNYRESLISPGESVGVISAQSIGERNTQNSCEFEAEILVKKNNKIIKTTVGDLIENEMKKGCVIKFQGDNYIKEVSNIEVLTISQEEKIEWKNVTELSKHPTNGDLVKIKTESGRQVVTTLSHSHLKKFEDSIIPILGSELKIGDRLPVIKRSPNSNNLEFIYISDYIEHDKIENDYIYINKTKIKNKIYLDKNFGWFLGAYLSNGYCTEYSISIMNITPEFEDNIKKFCSIYELKYKKTTHDINCIILCKLIKKLCNTESINKKLPDFIYQTKKDFISNIIKGYMDDNQNIFTCKNKKIIKYSIYKNLLEEFRVLFTYFGIFTTIDICQTLYQLTIYGKDNIIKYRDKIGTDLLYKKDILDNLIINTKDNLEKIPYHIGRHITIISSILNLKGYSNLKDDIERNTLGRFIKIFKDEAKLKNINIEKNLKYCELSYNSDVVWDKIIDIEIIKEKDYKYKYVYDFSVKGNETFALFSGIVIHNTLNTLNNIG